MKATVTYVGPVADTLDDGRPVAPGEVVKSVDLDAPYNAWLLEEGRLIKHEPARKKAGDEETKS